MADIYRKTEKGLAEIETRAHRLAPRLRNALILVDGRRSLDDLRKLILTDADGALQALADQGFVELVPAAPKPAPAPTPAAAAPREAPAPRHQPGSLLEFEAMRRNAARMLTDQLGPLADALAIRMEKAATMEQLRPLLEQAVAAIRANRGAAAAAAFSDRFL